jgi:NAD(P)-dependent dehydrogenase (short-subunit alcohol dehydrogenase family)
MMLFSLNGKKIVVTGGCSGIGKSIALTFMQQGAEVHVIDLNQAAEALPQSIHFHQADITDLEAVEQIATRLSYIDILVNNAGIPQIGNLEKTSPTDFQRIFDVNVKGAYHCMYAFIPQMVNQGSGVILNMASVAASVGIPDRFGYSMTKGAIKSMTQSVAKDYIQQGIRCNCISPGRVHTPFVDGFIAKNYPDNQAEMFEKLSKTQPLGRMAKPDEIANLALYLCSDEAAFITGCDYPIDGGFIYLNN